MASPLGSGDPADSAPQPQPFDDEGKPERRYVRWMPWAGVIDSHNPTVAMLLESCITKSAMASVGGLALGGVFGLFMSSHDHSTTHKEMVELSKQPWLQQARTTATSMARQSWSWSKNFAMVGGLFAGTECIVERARARTDSWNAVTAGCMTGAGLAYKSGPQAMCFGCVGFAAFSVVIDYAMGHLHFGPIL